MGIEPTLSAWKAEVLPLNYTRPSSFVYRQPPSSLKSRIRLTPVWFPLATWWRGEDSNLRRLSQQIYSLPPLTAREPLRDFQTFNFLSFALDRQDFSAKFPGHWPIFPPTWSPQRDSNPRPADSYPLLLSQPPGIRVWGLDFLFTMPRPSGLGVGGWYKVSTLAPALFSPVSQCCGASTGLPFCLISRQRGFPRFSHLH